MDGFVERCRRRSRLDVIMVVSSVFLEGVCTCPGVCENKLIITRIPRTPLVNSLVNRTIRSFGTEISRDSARLQDVQSEGHPAQTWVRRASSEVEHGVKSIVCLPWPICPAILRSKLPLSSEQGHLALHDLAVGNFQHRRKDESLSIDLFVISIGANCDGISLSTSTIRQLLLALEQSH